MSRWIGTRGPHELEAIRLVAQFIRPRMMQRRTLQWALEQSPLVGINRAAVRQVLALMDADLVEPWRSAWRLVEEGWDDEASGDGAIESHRARGRLESGERTGALIRAITEVVRPRLKITVRPLKKGQKPPKRLHDLVGGTLDSHDLLETGPFELSGVDDLSFLESLADSLEGVVDQARRLAARLSPSPTLDTWRLGQLHWVAYRPASDPQDDRDIDGFHGGIAPAVKLLHAVSQRIGQIDPARASVRMARWALMPNPVYTRLWAALAVDPRLGPEGEVEDRLLALDSATFWDLNDFPELIELRARRFRDLSDRARGLLERRILRGPPASHWSKWMSGEQIDSAKRYWIARELRRIQLGDGPLSSVAGARLAQAAGEFPELAQSDNLQLDFPGDTTFFQRGQHVAIDYDALAGRERLDALESALGESERSWGDDPRDAALTWIRAGRNAERIAADLVAVTPQGFAYPRVLSPVGWAFALPESGTEAPEAQSVARRFLAFVGGLPTEIVRDAIAGLSYWMSSVAGVLGPDEAVVRTWLFLWPVAVEATNAGSRVDAEPDLNEVVTGSSGDGDQQDLDALNVPAGHLLSAFLRLCPTVDGTFNPFETVPGLGDMRSAVTTAPGKAGLVGLHRLIEHLAYFLNADPVWAQANLMAALEGNDGRSLALWRALSRRMPNRRVLESIGHLVAQRAIDPELGRDRRVVLLTSLVFDALNAFLQPRDPIVSHERIQQTIRASDDEVRARTAQAVQRFLAGANGQMAWEHALTPERVFAVAIAPLLRQIWPQERSLATAGVAAAFVDLPAAAGESFVDAVHAVKRFLVPFNAWSLSDYGFWGSARPNQTRPLSRIDTPQRAEALLVLLDATIGRSDDAVVPMDLGEALVQIESQSTALAQSPAFRRLAALSRRS